MYDLLYQESMWNAMALEEGKRSSSRHGVLATGPSGKSQGCLFKGDKDAQSVSPQTLPSIYSVIQSTYGSDLNSSLTRKTENPQDLLRPSSSAHSSPGNLQVYGRVVLTLVPTLCFYTPGLTHLVNRNLCSLTTFIHCPQPTHPWQPPVYAP